VSRRAPSVVPAGRDAKQARAFRYLRPEVQAFAKLMERQLRANDFKGGWDRDPPLALLRRLRQETDELEQVLTDLDEAGEVFDDDRVEIGCEAADVANFAMMVADVMGSLRKQ
jgi:NTP pyrophosphatase (non-canonical NTP hydrolase)